MKKTISTPIMRFATSGSLLRGAEVFNLSDGKKQVKHKRSKRTPLPRNRGPEEQLKSSPQKKKPRQIKA